MSGDKRNTAIITKFCKRVKNLTKSDTFSNGRTANKLPLCRGRTGAARNCTADIRLPFTRGPAMPGGPHRASEMSKLRRMFRAAYIIPLQFGQQFILAAVEQQLLAVLLKPLTLVLGQERRGVGAEG